jgi:probable HAF family extracellular repeat protein
VRNFVLRICVVALASFAAQAAPQYVMVPLGDLPGGAVFSQTENLNNAGQIVGFSIASTGTRAFLWSPGSGMRDLGDLPGGIDYSRAFGLNEVGVVVGMSEAPGGLRAFRWSEAAGMEALPSPVRTAYDVNDAGIIVGYGPVNGGFSAFRWDATSGAVDLGDLPGGPIDSYATAINESGLIAGYGSGSEGIRALLWDGLDIEVLGELPGGVARSRASDINEHDMVSGSSHASQAGMPNGERPFLWDAESGIRNLGNLPGANDTFALGLNNNGQVVGYGQGSSSQRAFLWEANEIYDLNDLVSDDDPLKPYVALLTATDINDFGAIAATGVDSRTGNTLGYLLVPVAGATLESLAEAVVNVGPGRSLAQKVAAAQAYLAAADVTATCEMLVSFENEVLAQRGKHIDVELSDALLQDAHSIKMALGCE